jgi:hypothetical protein
MDKAVRRLEGQVGFQLLPRRWVHLPLSVHS